MLSGQGFEIEESRDTVARLELEDWFYRGGAEPAARAVLREEFARMPETPRRRFEVEAVDGVTRFGWPMLVLRAARR